jgi:hypothetical protein
VWTRWQNENGARFVFKFKREKLSMIELDLLIKHSRPRKDVIVIRRIIIGEYFVCSNSHVKSEKVYGTTWHLVLLNNYETMARWRKT